MISWLFFYGSSCPHSAVYPCISMFIILTALSYGYGTLHTVSDKLNNVVLWFLARHYHANYLIPCKLLERSTKAGQPIPLFLIIRKSVKHQSVVIDIFKPN